MKKSTFLKFAIVFNTAAICALSATAQQVAVTGRVFSSSSKESLPMASVSLLGRDSSLKRSSLTDSLGNFVFVGLEAGQYILQVNSLSYKTLNKNLLLPTKGIQKLDSVFLTASYGALSSVTIVSKKSSVIVKNDTTEFSSTAFKVRKNGTVEDMFKKMPGLEVDKNGGIKAQGETVTQIYVDGKPFFGTDFKSVTQNFPADVIDKIQIIDKRSDQALATKVEDGIREKIINITLKKNRRRGIFGKDYIAGGTDGRYEGKTNTNFFNNDKKISFIAGANNTGRNDNNNSGSDDASYNNWNGTTDNEQVKLNYADKYGKNFDFSAWAGYERNKNIKQQLINRQNIFTDSSTYYTEANHSTSISNNAYLGLYFEYRPDTLTFVRCNQSVGYNTYNNNAQAVFYTNLADSLKVNGGSRASSNHSTSPNVNGQVSYNHRFGNTRRNIFINVNNNINTNKAQLYNLSNNNFYPVDSNAFTLLLNQLQYNTNRTTRVGATVSYSEPVAEKSNLNLSYNYNYGLNDIPKEVYNYNYITKLYDFLNDTLSSHYNNYTYNSAVQLNYNYTGKNAGFGAGVRWQNAITESHPLGKDSIYQQTYKGFSPNVNFYANARGMRFNMYYSFNVQAPQAYQLQPLIDNSNPLYIKLGNPDLLYAEVHTVRYNLNYYNSHSETGFNSNAGFSSIVNNIANSTMYTGTSGSYETKPINTDGAYNWNAWFSYFSPFFVGKDKIKWNINLYANGYRNVNLLNGTENVNLGTTAKLSFGLTYDTRKWIDMHTGFSVTRQETGYSLQPDLNNNSYFVDVNPNITIIPLANTEINIDYDYRQTTGQAAGFNTSINMVNADITQYFGAKKAIWLKLKAYDLLNQNVSIWRSNTDSYVQDTRANVLSRFLLLSLNFRLNKFISSNTANSDLPDDARTKM